MKTGISNLRQSCKIHLIGLCAFFALAAGCATATKSGPLATQPAISRSTLPSEKDIPFLATLSAAFDQLPRKTTLVPTDCSNRIVQVAVHELGSGDRDSLIMLVHGVLACQRVWRFVAPELARDHDVWLVDMPGCGASDKPDPRQLESDGYGPTALADRVLQAITVRLAARGPDHPPQRITLVGHSLGGTVSLRAFAEPGLRARHSSTLARIDHLVLLAPADVAVHAEIPVFRRIVDFTSWKAALGQAFGLVHRATEQATIKSFQMTNYATREAAAELERVFTNPASLRAARAMLAQAVPWRQKEHRPDWPAIQRLADYYVNIDVPCLIVWGKCDETLPASMGHKLKDEIPGAQFVKLPGCGHQLPGERPMEIAALIQAYITGKPLPLVEAKPLQLKSVVGQGEDTIRTEAMRL